MKTRNLILIALLIGINLGIGAQVTEKEAILRKKNADEFVGWKKGGVTSLNLAQTSLINWAAGGQNSVAVNGLLSLFANYKNDKSTWDNSLDVGYGLLRQGKGTDFMKTDDKFDLLSKYGRQAFKDFYYSGLLNFKTQMTVGKSYGADTVKISNLLAPAYFLGALGMDYKPNTYFSAFLAPITGKVTIVNDQELADLGAFGVEPGKRSKSELGGYVRMIFSKSDFTKEFLKGFSFTTKIDLFSNYLKDPQNIDVNWETQIAMKVNRYFSVNINTHLLYDYDIKFDVDNGGVIERKALVQFKEIFGVGFTYKF